MATLTKRGTLIISNSSVVTNPSNVVDTSDTTYGKITIPKASNKDFVIGGFDFSEIPDGSTINSFSLKSYVGLDNNVSCIMVATRKYNNGVFDNEGVTSSAAFGSAGTLATNAITEKAPFSIFAGFSAEDINQDWSSANDYTGIAFYIRYKNSSSSTSGSSYSAYPRYFDLTVDYTPPPVAIVTEASPAEGGTISGGGMYTPGSLVTLTAIANNGYAFSHWLIDGVANGVTDPILSGPANVDVTVTAVFVKVETSKVYCGSKKVSVYCGTKKVSVYCGTQKLT